MTTSIATLLASLNIVRIAEGKAPLKSWKGSRAALEKACGHVTSTKGETLVAEGAYPTESAAERSTGIKGKAAKSRARLAKALAKDEKKEKPVKAKASPKAKAVKVKGEFITLAEIARDLKIEPKVARAKCRRSDAMSKLSKGDAWQFLPKDVKAVKEFLKTDQRKGE